MSTLTRSIAFAPAYDERPKKKGDPDYGIHGVEIRFVLQGDRGAVQFVLFTNWQLPEVTKEQAGKPYTVIDGDPHWMERPMPADLGYHALTPQYEGQASQEDCPFLGGQTCYYDGSGLRALPVYERLLREGDAGVWAVLEAEYQQRFCEQDSQA